MMYDNGQFVILVVYLYKSSNALQYMIFDSQNAYDRWLARSLKRGIKVLSDFWRFVHV